MLASRQFVLKTLAGCHGCGNPWQAGHKREMTNLAVIIVTFNKELHFERAIRSVRPIAKQIFVVDSCSTDRTAEIAKELEDAYLRDIRHRGM